MARATCSRLFSPLLPSCRLSLTVAPYRLEPPPRGIPNRLSLLPERTRRLWNQLGSRCSERVYSSARLLAASRAPRRSVSSFLIDSARQSRLSDLLGRSTRWLRRDGWAGVEHKGGGWRGLLLGVAERGRDSVGGRCGLIVIGKAPRAFSRLFPSHTRVRELVARKLTPLSRSRRLSPLMGYAQLLYAPYY